MSGKLVSDSQIIQMTAKCIRSFYNHEDIAALVTVAENFFWIGSEEVLDPQGRVGAPPAVLSEEEYRLLLHERNVWVVYGRFSVTTSQENSELLCAPMCGTFVWRRVQGVVQLRYAHTSPLPAPPAEGEEAREKKSTGPDSRLLDYVRRMDSQRADTEKIMFRENRRNRRYLYPDEILYIEAAQQRVIVHTKTETFGATRLIADYEQNLPEYFKRIHKSFLVNTDYIQNVSCKEVVLQDGQKLPVGRNRSSELKKYLLSAKRSAGHVYRGL